MHTQSRFTAALMTIALDASRERIAIADLLDALGDRALATLLLLFAMPNIVPTPPGTSAILGTPLVFLSAQLALGRKPWLPKWIAQRSLNRADFAKLMERIVPWLAKAERYLGPRWLPVTTPAAERLIGLLCLALAVVLTLPIPLGNIPPAFAISLMALGIMERDGLWIFVGMVTGVMALVLVSGVVLGLLKASLILWHEFSAL